jgi:hypothetical protein
MLSSKFHQISSWSDSAQANGLPFSCFLGGRQQWDLALPRTSQAWPLCDFSLEVSALFLADWGGFLISPSIRSRSLPRPRILSYILVQNRREINPSSFHPSLSYLSWSFWWSNCFWSRSYKWHAQPASLEVALYSWGNTLLPVIYPCILFPAWLPGDSRVSEKLLVLSVCHM